MGNQGSTLGEEPMPGGNYKNLHHFDHSFKADIHTTSGNYFEKIFGVCKFSKRPVEIVCKSLSFEINEEVGLTARKTAEVKYEETTDITWDHAHSEVKLLIDRGDGDEHFLILTMANSVEFEGEIKMRYSSLAQIAPHNPVRFPLTLYVGMFAGATKPKPFQRKRPNLSTLKTGKLPSLADMRSLATQWHYGSYNPCPPGESRRIELALQHMYEGCNYFPLLNIRGSPMISSMWNPSSMLVIMDEMLVFKPSGFGGPQTFDFPYETINDWNAIDNENSRANYANDSGIEIQTISGETIYFGVRNIRDVKHTVEYFWNKHRVSNGKPVKLGSTHGRPLVSMTTLSGEVVAPESPTGQSEVVDPDGIAVRPGTKMAPRRRTSLIGSLGQSNEPTVVPNENKKVKKHWHQIVMHQGWLLKKGGMGVGAAKAWIKRYFVLYKTSQGHFLVYYSDFTECPLFSTDKNHRNIVDLAKATFIRPGSNKSIDGDVPPHSFDIVTIEREWTLCAESQDNVAKWLRVITRAVDEDVAILPDEDLLFKVKPKIDPTGFLNRTDYSTSLKISAFGVSLCSPSVENPQNEVEHCFWIYTDFFKWSLVQQNGKLALLVNVFSDDTFQDKKEFTFRHKEAIRLATAIEFFIEKFMSVMHIKLEVIQSDEPADEDTHGGMHHVDEWAEDVVVAQPVESDLLGLDGPPTPTDPFGGGDPFANDPPPKVRLPSQAPSATSKTAADPFGGGDPFGDADPFGVEPPASTPVAAGQKMAPPLTQPQLSQHAMWYQGALQNKGGPFYDDGSMQIAIKVEVRGSQARVLFMFRNQSPTEVKDFEVLVKDEAGLLRHQLSTVPSSVAALAQGQFQMMVECMKPVYPGPVLTLTYIDGLMGKRSNTLNLPILITSFNEPLIVQGADFMARWQQLTSAGQEMQQVFRPSRPVTPAAIQKFMTAALQFGHIMDLPDSSDTVVYGASSLRTGATTQQGEKISIGCLVKLEIHLQSNSVRVTVRTLHPAATHAIVEVARALLA